MQRDALGIGGGLAGVALIDIGELAAAVSCILNIRGKALHGGPIADIGRGEMQGKQVVEVLLVVHQAAAILTDLDLTGLAPETVEWVVRATDQDTDRKGDA